MVSTALPILDSSARKSQAKQVRYAMGDGVNPFIKPPVSAIYKKTNVKGWPVFSGGSDWLRLHPLNRSSRLSLPGLLHQFHQLV